MLLSVRLLGWSPDLGALAGQTAILATAFIGSANMLGAIDNLLARLLLDYVCRRTVRRFFMRALLGYRLEIEHPTRTAIDKRYSAVITAGLSCGNARVEAEVAKRRQTARIMRSALIPVFAERSSRKATGVSGSKWRPTRTLAPRQSRRRRKRRRCGGGRSLAVRRGAVLRTDEQVVSR